MPKPEQVSRGPTPLKNSIDRKTKDRPPVSSSLTTLLLEQLAQILEQGLKTSPQGALWPEDTPVLTWLQDTISLAEQGRQLRKHCEPLHNLNEQIQHHLHHLQEQLRVLRTRTQQGAAIKTIKDGIAVLQAHLQSTLNDCRSLQRYLVTLRHQNKQDPGAIFQITLDDLLQQPDDPAVALENLQRRLLSATHEAFLGQLTRYMIHDLGSPASYMLSNLSAAQAILRDTLIKGPEDFQASLPPLWEELHTIGEDTREGTLRIRDILRELDTWQSNLTSTATATIPVETLVSQALRMTRTRSTQTFVDLEPGLFIKGDSGQVLQILNNLINNALDAQELSKRPMEFTFRAFSRGSFIHLEISNEGPVIPPELHEKIFEPFFTTQPKDRSGLGLIICRTLAERQQATLLMDSNARRTAFTLRLPNPEHPA